LSLGSPAVQGAGDILEVVGLIIKKRNTKAQNEKAHRLLAANPLTTDPLTTNPLTTNPLTTNPLTANPLTATRPMLMNRIHIDIRKPITILIHNHPIVMICGKRREGRELRESGQSAPKMSSTREGKLQGAGHRHSTTRIISKRKGAGELRLQAAGHYQRATTIISQRKGAGELRLRAAGHHQRATTIISKRKGAGELRAAGPAMTLAST
jgi:hypothetical protein